MLLADRQLDLGTSAASETESRRNWYVFARNTVSLFLHSAENSILTDQRTIAASVTKLVFFYKIAVGTFLLHRIVKHGRPLTTVNLQSPIPETRISHV